MKADPRCLRVLVVGSVCMTLLVMYSVNDSRSENRRQIEGIAADMGSDIAPILIRYRNRREQMISHGSSRNLVCVFDSGCGFGNRMMHLVSCLAASILTDRVLYFDWPEVRLSDVALWVTLSIYGEDVYSRSSYASLFKTFLPGAKVPEAKLEPQTPENTLNCYSFGMKSPPACEQLIRTRALDQEFTCKTLYAIGWNYWGSSLFNNSLYAKSHLASFDRDGFFHAALVAMFQPRFEMSLPIGCEWVIQYRAIRKQKTAPLDDYVHCAIQNGFLENRTAFNFLLSDVQVSVPGFISLDKGCRTGYECDKQAILQMHLASTCRHAVLTSESTYGQMATSIGNVQNVWMVKEDGSCTRKIGNAPDHLT